jgi:hypothetical protein
MPASQQKVSFWQNLFKGSAPWRCITVRSQFMKTFVKIPLCDWSGTGFEVPIARGNLHSPAGKALSWPEKRKPLQPILCPAVASAALSFNPGVSTVEKSFDVAPLKQQNKLTNVVC